MSGYKNCKWCYGKGCNQCSYERKKDADKFEKEGPQPIFTAKLDEHGNIEDVDLANMAIGRESLEKAFGPDGGGVAEVERNCAIASLLQAGRAKKPKEALKAGEK